MLTMQIEKSKGNHGGSPIRMMMSLSFAHPHLVQCPSYIKYPLNTSETMDNEIFMVFNKEDSLSNRNCCGRSISRKEGEDEKTGAI